MKMFSSKLTLKYLRMLTKTFSRFSKALMSTLKYGLTTKHYGSLTPRRFIKGLETTSINGKHF